MSLTLNRKDIRGRRTTPHSYRPSPIPYPPPPETDCESEPLMRYRTPQVAEWSTGMQHLHPWGKNWPTSTHLPGYNGEHVPGPWAIIGMVKPCIKRVSFQNQCNRLQAVHSKESNTAGARPGLCFAVQEARKFGCSPDALCLV
jgi:hypothetical protein